MGLRGVFAVLMNRGAHRHVESVGPALSDAVGLTVEELYRTQPHLRTVVSFLARNVAQLGLPAFERVSDTDRRRHGGQLAKLLSKPNSYQTRYELFESLVSDLALYDAAYWVVIQLEPGRWAIQPVPPSWVVELRGGTFFEPGTYVVLNPHGKRTEIDAVNVLAFHGWNPGRPQYGSSPVDSLRHVLAEQVHAWQYRQQLWQRGGRVGAFITRPADAPAWSPEAKSRFERAWQAGWAGNTGPKAGGTPVLEEGMRVEKLGFSAREDEWAEVSKLSLATVASVYHTNPTMVGLLDNANYSNVKEFRKMLYGETLGPILAMIQDRLNTFLVPKVTGREDVYVEFNIAQKLQGDFEEQAVVLSSSVGAPWMTRNEARGKLNLPSLGDNGDALVTPLNVLIGGQSSPHDGVTPGGSSPGAGKAAGSTVSIKSPDFLTQEWSKQSQDLFTRFFKRQGKTVLSRLGAKADTAWWDEKRWNNELSDTIYALAVTASTQIGQDQAAALGFDSDAYDADLTYAFLRHVANSRAQMVNSTTRKQIEAVLESADVSASSVFAEAESFRAGSAGTALMAAIAGFAVTEAGKQIGGAQATKTWIVTSKTPRSEHALMRGETVGIDETFSNGARWPGDPVLGASGVAHCLCGVEVIYTG